MTAAIDRREPFTVSFLNPYYVIEASRDPSLRDFMHRSDVLQADGWGVVYGARLAGRTVPERVAIEDIEWPLFQAFAERGAGVFLFGAGARYGGTVGSDLAGVLPRPPDRGNDAWVVG